MGTGVRIVAAAVACAAATVAASHDLPHPPPFFPTSILGALARAEALPEPQEALRLMQETLERRLALFQEVDASYRGIFDEAGYGIDAAVGPNTLARIHALADHGANRAADLLSELHARIASALPPEKAPEVEACRRLTLLWLARSRLDPGELAGADVRDLPADLSYPVLAMGGGNGADPEVRAHCVILAAMGAEARIAALEEGRRHLLRHEESLAAKVRAHGGEGGPDLRPFAASFPTGPGTPVWAGLVEAQLASWRELEPLLSPADRAVFERGWIPAMVGASVDPRGFPSPWGCFGLPSMIQMVLAQPTLAEADREQARVLCRAWLEDDRAIITEGFRRLVETGREVDVSAARAARAQATRAALQRIPGLEWMTGVDAPFVEYVPLQAGDVQEFGDHLAQAVARSRDPSASGAGERLPPMPSRQDGAVIARIVGAGPAELPVLTALVEDWHQAWRESVAPALAGAVQPAPPSALMLERDRHVWQAAREAAETRAEELWAASRALDDALADDVQIALSDRLPPGAADLLRAWLHGRADAIRALRGVAPAEPGSGPPPDMAVALVDARLSDGGQQAARAGLAFFLPAWNELRRRIDTATDAIRTEPNPSRSRAERAALVAQASDLAAQMEAAVTQAVAEDPGDRARWAVSAAATRAPRAGVDPRPLLAAVAASRECLPAEARDAFSTAAEPILIHVFERCAATLKAPALTDPLPADPERHRALSALQRARRISTSVALNAELAVAGARVALLLPAECRPLFDDDRALGLLRVLGAQTRLPGSAPNTSGTSP